MDLRTICCIWVLPLCAACGSGDVVGSGDAGGGASGPDASATGAGSSSDTGGPGGGGDGASTGGGTISGSGGVGSTSSATTGGSGRGPATTTIDATDFPSIQDAIDSLEQTGGAVYIPEGTHLVAEKLRVHSHVTVFGAGMDKTVIALAPDAPKDHLMSNDSSSGQTDITIRGLTLLGGGPDPGINDCCYGLKLENLTDSFVIDVASDHHGRDGFYLGYKIKSGDAKGVYGVRLSSCRATKNGRNGISLVHGSGNVIDDSLIAENNTNELVAAIDLEPDEDLDVSDNLVVGNHVEDNENNGIGLYSAGGAYVVSSNAVCYNVVSGNDGTGIADNGEDDVFVDNDFAGNGADQSLDGSAKEGPQFASDCGVPLAPLPATPPLPAR